jgi:hypothetical protein
MARISYHPDEALSMRPSALLNQKGALEVRSSF